MYVGGTDMFEIINIVSQLNTSDGIGNDGISAKIVKSTISEIAQPLAIAFNKSLETGIFPDKLKIAKIIPIHKADDKLCVGNYRPISILPFFSKILERLMYNRLLDYIDVNSILVNNQYGFRKKNNPLSWLF
jgi:hypothetical protein